MFNFVEMKKGVLKRQKKTEIEIKQKFFFEWWEEKKTGVAIDVIKTLFG